MDFDALDEAEEEASTDVERLQTECHDKQCMCDIQELSQELVLARLTTPLTNPDIRDLEQRGRSCMHFAAARSQGLGGAAEVARRLGELGVRVDTKDTHGQTPLFFAACEGNLECAQYLVEKRCNVNHCDKIGQTAAFYAAREGHADVLAFLHQAHASLDHSDHLHQTSLFYAARKGHVDCCKLLVQLKCNPKHTDNLERTALSYATRAGQSKVVEELHRLQDKGRTEVATSKLQLHSRNRLPMPESLQIIEEPKSGLLYRPDIDIGCAREEGIDLSYSKDLGLPGVGKANPMPAVRLPRLLSDKEISELLDSARHDSRHFGSVSRDGKGDHELHGQWTTHYLHTGGWFQTRFPALYARCVKQIMEVDREHWGLLDAAPCKARLGCPVARTIELHTVEAGGSLSDPLHFDSGSMWTLDIMLASPGTDFQGGYLQIAEKGKLGQARQIFERGDAIAFVSHKHHSVSPVIEGLRRVLVMEFWHGEERKCAHRCLTRWGPCEYDAERSREDRLTNSKLNIDRATMEAGGVALSTAFVIR